MIRLLLVYVHVLFNFDECVFNFWGVGPFLSNECGI